jgi:hypothetical protein
MKTLIIGAGEVGKSLFNILEKYYPTEIYDKNSNSSRTFDILHICFPYSEEFIEAVKYYQKIYVPQYTIIHSTVPIGTSKKCGAIHSPVIGIHPHLEEGIKTFPKYLGGEQASEVADYFRRAGLTVLIFDKSETTELMKILDTTFYGVCIEYTKDVKRQCEKYGVPFEAWNIWTRNYNEGYTKLNHPEYTRPNLVPIMTNIKGHCVRPNLELIDTPFTRILKELNKD